MLRFVTRGYVAPAPRPTLFTHWGYLAQEPEPETERPRVSLMTQPSRRSEEKPTSRVMEDDFELLTIIYAYIKARYS